MPISESLKNTLLSLTNAKSIQQVQLIQGVWGGYGELLRVTVQGGRVNSLVVKSVHTPQPSSHPKGWNTKRSHQRKLHSYQVEANWYKNYAHQLNSQCYVPRCFAAQSDQQSHLLVLEDLTDLGYPIVKTTVTVEEAKKCIKWLAHFHALHLHKSDQNNYNDLWETGTYWHLATRPDELAALQDMPLKLAATRIDQILTDTPFQTLVHGDAKLANFCFSEDAKQVAAVDFQYVGGGCGMKDLILFISSAIPPEHCARLQNSLIDYYFACLSEAVVATGKGIDPMKLEQAWRPLYAIAWADFQRFVKGWSPNHWKINDYTENLTAQALSSLTQFPERG
ncbi:phosphotransferase [Psychromonas aquatilis]|uniref:Phosphotransferase n=1 Tax=Psychromonas aquatilis TaxID=2005072 RepID=A0ABU9GT56_9GAMM